MVFLFHWVLERVFDSISYDSVIQESMYSVRFSPEEEKLIENYIQLTGMTISEIIRRFTIERIEDEMDADIIRQAVKEYRTNPKTYTFEEEMKRLGLN